MSEEKKTKVIFCVPFLERPNPHFVKALEDSVPCIEAAGYEHGVTQEMGNAYISGARAAMLRRALDANADIVVFLDYDLSWDPEDLLKLIQTEGDVVAGTYRFKNDNEEYMSTIDVDKDGRPRGRESDGCIRADRVPAGFLKVTKEAVEKFMCAYPDLCFGAKYNQSIDLFNHGAHRGVWWGEDYAFSRNWKDCGGDIWLVPNLNITHWAGETPYPGNFHEYLMRRPGGKNDPNRKPSEVIPFPFPAIAPAFSNEKTKEL